MNTQPITPNFTGNAVTLIVPRHNQNAARHLFYNDLSNIIKTNKVPAEIHNNGVDIHISDSNYQAKTLNKITETLDKLGIFFTKKTK